MTEAYILVDTNVILDVLTRDARWFGWSSNQLHRVMVEGHGVINPLIYAEICRDFRNRQEVEEALEPLALQRIDLPWEAAFAAGQAHNVYRQRGGQKQTTLPDFYIGAHAQVHAMPILTRDARPYRTYFSGVDLICPDD